MPPQRNTQFIYTEGSLQLAITALSLFKINIQKHVIAVYNVPELILFRQRARRRS